ncbi:GDP-L-fucose synthase [Hypericibacter terrae]|uniref:GDP-L-fucose synthase n=1 Tax=Hypericibacter terrae TaxID=2602015 RepID=A0A5J6MDV6_9PROT|nr:GDP-L-fucose synthase [Hypericibacter terrae]QEX15552.1 GDP-L-fucose synthase [Hypericibacter terrae]
MTGKVPFDLAGRRVFVAGHRGMVGQAICRRLAGEKCEILTVRRAEVDLRRQQATEDWVAKAKPDAVFVAAATVGGILANATRPAEFLYDNLAIETNLIEASRKSGVAKLLFLGSSCIYPREAAQPMAETALLTGPLEPTNEWYAIAKIAGIKMAQAYRRQHGCDYISAMPTNLYGPGDNFDLQSSHVVPALIAKIHAAKTEGRGEVEIWGSGRPKREFLFVDDLADALVHLMKHYSDEPHLNVGTGSDVTIAELAETIARVVGWQGKFRYDASKPDGTPRKLVDVSKLAALGWKAKTPLDQGLTLAYGWYREALAQGAVTGGRSRAGAA